jgi:hypothetical protein
MTTAAILALVASTLIARSLPPDVSFAAGMTLAVVALAVWGLA